MAPEFGYPALSLSNRTVSDLGEVLYAYALKITERKPEAGLHCADCLTLITYRTADLDIAAPRLAPRTEASPHGRPPGQAPGDLAGLIRNEPNAVTDAILREAQSARPVPMCLPKIATRGVLAPMMLA